MKRKRWSDYDVKKIITLCENGMTYNEISKNIDRTPKAIKEKLNKLGYKQNKDAYYIEKSCLNCGELFTSLISENRKYCSNSCAATINNKIHVKRKRNKKYCIWCNNELSYRQIKYCSITCKVKYDWNIRKSNIENGYNNYPSETYKKYLIERHGNKCMKCGWNERHPITGKVPIELEHKDGNSENNNLTNLELLCPNCHSLTPTYKSLNAGNGRHKRRERYRTNKSY